jgi:hypothetical protein
VKCVQKHVSSLPFVLHAPLSLILLDLIILITLGEEHKPCSPSLCSFLWPPVTPSLFRPNIVLSTLFLNILSLCSSFNEKDQVSHPYGTTGKMMVLYTISIYFYKVFGNNKATALKYIYIYIYWCSMTRMQTKSSHENRKLFI